MFWVNSSGNIDSFVRDYAFRRFLSGRARSGVLYQNISLPSNYSGFRVSVVRMRNSGLWLRGVNFSFFDVSSRTLPSPFYRRILIIYQNLANLSSVYYTVPNHTIIAPVIGLLAYNPHLNSNSTGENNDYVLGNKILTVSGLVHAVTIQLLAQPPTSATVLHKSQIKLACMLL